MPKTETEPTTAPIEPDAPPPTYDPDVHTGEDMVSLDMWCACGAEHHQADPPEHLAGPIDTFRREHTGDGHGPVTADVSLTEREERRWASLRALGRQAEFVARAPREATAGFDWEAGR